MEQIKVNMTPCGFTPTIHASQDDNSTRKWGFDLYDEDGKIDSSSIKEQMIFDSRVGGTEQILPENGSDPTTSPIIADIQYPDSLRSEQTFLYRESPTSEDGQAKITHIKGNTVVFNQLIEDSTFSNTQTDSRNYVAYGFQILNGGSIVQSVYVGQISSPSVVKYLFTATANGTSLRFRHSGAQTDIYMKAATVNVFANHSYVVGIKFAGTNPSSVGGLMATNFMLIDLTQMFDSGNEPTIDQLTSLYSLPYYDYTTGKLLPFVGTELKTTGKNLFDKSTPIERGQYQSGAWNNLNTRITTDYMRIIPNIDYTMSIDLDNSEDLAFINYNYFDGNKNWLGGRTENGDSSFAGQKQKTFNIHNSSAMYVRMTIRAYSSAEKNISSVTLENAELQLEFGSSATSYEPYTSSTINLPTLDYFPSGMKSAGSVYDELTESKAITRVGSVDLGNLTYQYITSYSNPIFATQIPDRKAGAQIGSNYESDIYNKNTINRNAQSFSNNASNMDIAFSADGNSKYIYIRNDSYATAAAFQAAMSNQYLYYELATPTEEDITTASLITEKGETPLYYDDGLIADCNEAISSESGIFDAKIKLMADETIYSQKIQLHVERKP